MEHRVYPWHLRTKIVSFSIKWEEAITRIAVFCAVSAIAFGMVWLFFKEMALLYVSMGFSSFYFICKKFWKFRHGVLLQSPPYPEQGERITQRIETL